MEFGKIRGEERKSNPTLSKNDSTPTTTTKDDSKNNNMSARPVHLFRLGNFAKSLLEKAQSEDSDLKLSPTTIQTLINPMRTRPLQMPNCTKNLTGEAKLKANIGDLPGCNDVQTIPLSKAEKENVHLPLNPTRPAFKFIPKHQPKTPERKIFDEKVPLATTHMRGKQTAAQTPTAKNKTENTTLPFKNHRNQETVAIPSFDAIENETLDDSQTKNTTKTLPYPRMRTEPMPTLKEYITPDNSSKTQTLLDTNLRPRMSTCEENATPGPGPDGKRVLTQLVNSRMRTYPLLNYDEHSSEFMVAYRQSNDALSSELRPRLHPTTKQDSFTPFRNNVHSNANSEVAARIPPVIPQGDQNPGPRMYGLGQGQMGMGTPVGQRTPLPKFCAPSSAGKGKSGNLKGNKPANAWKFRKETVAGKEYIIMKELGKGGCGHVDLVMEKESRQLYALKKVNLTGIDEAVVLECINEVEMLKELRDTDLVIQIFSWELNDGDRTMKIVMEYGQCDLNSSVKSANCTVVKLKYIWERILMIVATIHSKGIVHADLKPANFVWVGDSLKIIDFGIANRLQSDHTSIATINPKGTVNFIGPETIRPDATGKTKISPKSDIWSLGCILYMMVYGKTPFQEITHYMAKINAISTGSVAYPPLPSYLQQYSGVVDVLKSCFQLDPKARPTALELLNHTFLK